MGNSTTAIFIDFRKAFDTVNHNILLAKLPGFGFNTHLTKWFRSYLSGRVQCTIANSTTSDWLPVTHGVPQGSILGPLMFLLYINDLSNTVSASKSILFADDTVIFRADRNSDRNTASLRDNLDSLNDWCNRNKVTINTDKTKIVTFFPKRNSSCPNLFINRTEIKHQPTYKYLGITLDNHLNFKPHLANTIKTINHKLYMMRKIKHSMTNHAMLGLFKAMVLSYFDFGSIFYTICPTKDTDKLHILQNRALRLCLNINDPRQVPVRDLHTTAGISPIVYRQNTQMLTCIHNQIKLGTIPVLSSGRIATRHHDAPVINLPRPRFNTFLKSASYVASSKWNALPPAIRNIEDHDQFKTAIKALQH